MGLDTNDHQSGYRQAVDSSLISHYRRQDRKALLAHASIEAVLHEYSIPG